MHLTVQSKSKLLLYYILFMSFENPFRLTTLDSPAFAGLTGLVASTISGGILDWKSCSTFWASIRRTP